MKKASGLARVPDAFVCMGEKAAQATEAAIAEKVFRVRQTSRGVAAVKPTQTGESRSTPGMAAKRSAW